MSHVPPQVHSLLPSPVTAGTAPADEVALTDDISVEGITLTAADGYPLAATHVRGSGDRGAMVVAGATGVPQRYYRRFAEHAAARGWEVLTVDYRGIGQSAPESLRGFTADIRDWGRLDLQAAVDHAAQTRPERPVRLVGHSSGGHSYGLMTDPTPVGAAYLLGTGSGWHGWMPRLEQLRVRLLWNTLGPVLTRTTGYLAWSHLGMGEDLPLEVYQQWKAWCRYPHYFFDDPLDAEQARAAFARITAPIAAANATDDRWIPPVARDALMIGYANAPVTTIDLHPTRIGLPRLGHMGYFRPDARALWDDVLDWLESA